jgi:hypothetical protein
MTRDREAFARQIAREWQAYEAIHDGAPPQYSYLALRFHCSLRTVAARLRDAETLGLLVRKRGPWPVEAIPA